MPWRILSFFRGRILNNEGYEGQLADDSPDGRVTSRTISLNQQQSVRYVCNEISTAKYSIWSFVPKFVFEQFRRYSNIFFLLIALLQQIPDVSPTGKFNTLIPLITIMTISAVKELVEDWRRHRADDEINNRQVEVFHESHWLWKRWCDVTVGDICKVRSEHFFPADMVLLSSSEPQSLCYIETANLDGETNLKVRQAVPETACVIDSCQLQQLSASVECELPNKHLYQFVGTLRPKQSNAVSLGPDQLLLRGAKLRNTDWVFGAVVYSGPDTKLMKNGMAAPLKRSSMDRRTNTLIMCMFGVLLALCVISAVASQLWTQRHLHSTWYLALNELATLSFGYSLLTFIILYNNLIPISLQVTVEIARFMQAYYISMDVAMYHAPSNTAAVARTSNLNEELGQVSYVLTDKTGTLTENVMKFRHCSVAGRKFQSIEQVQQALQELPDDSAEANTIRDFIIMMAVCHTVIPDQKQTPASGGGQSAPGAPLPSYHAASPDEKALVEGAHQMGYTFTTRTPQTVVLETAAGQSLSFQILNVIEFSSDRKRMSVIVRRPDGSIQLMCKGADTVILERLGERRFADATLAHLSDFATDGLRTLCLAVRHISQQQYQDWSSTYHKASTAVLCREEKLEDAARLIETDLALLGASAIEDKLQEQVPETIDTLLSAGISVWVLTGDKQETAVNIGHSSRLLRPNMPLIVLNENCLDKTRDVIAGRLGELTADEASCRQRALVVDGATLHFALSDELRSDFMALCLACRSVICCRVSPGQKAEITELVTRFTGAVTLAIGDGANDVAMIQAAHVGVGVAGLEGLQAAYSSDYAIGQFRFLTRLLLVHGAWNYGRLTRVILYSFYKNICLYVMELWYAIYSGWSGQVMFDRWTIAAYNLVFTSVPPLVMGFIDRTCSAETRLKYPQLYRVSQQGELFTNKVFWSWIFNALIHSVSLFWLSESIAKQGVVWSNGYNGGYLMLGNMVYTYVVVCVSLKAGLETHSWTLLTHLAIWGSIVVWFLFLIVYSHLSFSADMIGLGTMVLSCPVFWSALVLVPLVTLLPDVLFKCVHNTMFKSLTEQVREYEILSRDPSALLNRQSSSKLTETARLLRNVKNVFCRSAAGTSADVELSRGYAFSQEEGGVVLQSELIRAYDTTIPKPAGM